MRGAAPTRARPEPSELVSLAERTGTLGGVRAGMVLVVLLFTLLEPAIAQAPAAELAIGSAAYLSLLLLPWAIRRVPRRRVHWIIAATLLVDGVYLAWVTYSTGGTLSPLRFLLFAHVVAVSLLASYRTGLKVAAWHSILYFVVLYGQAASILPIREALDSALPGGTNFRTMSILQVSALWFVALVAASCSAVNERELRIQKVDLEELSATVRDLDGRTTASEIPEVLLDSLCRVFGFTRGVVLASPRDDLALMAYRGEGEPPPIDPGLDRVTEQAWDRRSTQLVRTLDPSSDPRLSSLLPGARNVLVVPLLVDRGLRLGIVAVEHPARRHEIKRWVITVVEQFASHAALTLNNAWLRAELEQKLEENRALQAQLRSHNLELEVKVEERTQDLSESLENLRIVDEQRRRLLARLVHAEEETRKRIAEDIHDDPVQKMIATSMRIQLMRKSIADPAEREVFDQLLKVVRSSIDGMRHLIFELRPHALDQQGLGPALREYLESLKGDFEFQVDDRLDSQPPAELRVVLYRLAQEAFANAHKHAQADRVDVRLVEQDGGFLLRISDDGVGFASQEAVTPERGHLGLSSMRERAEMAGGWCRLLSLPGDGTTVEFWVPGQRPGADEHTDDRSALSIPDDLVLDPASLP